MRARPDIAEDSAQPVASRGLHKYSLLHLAVLLQPDQVPGEPSQSTSRPQAILGSRGGHSTLDSALFVQVQADALRFSNHITVASERYKERGLAAIPANHSVCLLVHAQLMPLDWTVVSLVDPFDQQSAVCLYWTGLVGSAVGSLSLLDGACTGGVQK